MASRLLLDVVVGQSASILKLFSSKNETLLVGRDTFLVLDLGLDIVDGVRGLNLEGDGFTRKAVEGARSVKVDLNVEGWRAYVLTKICISPLSVQRAKRWSR